MMGKFLTPLRVEEVTANHWELTEPLIYKSKTVGLVIVDEKFLTDFGSVKRLPFIYWLFGGIGNKECVLHDKLYSKPHDTGTGLIVDRGIADKVLRGAIYQGLKRDIPEDAGFMLSLGVVVNNVAAYAKAWCMWVGVRIGGGGIGSRVVYNSCFYEKGPDPFYPSSKHKTANIDATIIVSGSCMVGFSNP